MDSSLQIISTPTADSPGTVVILSTAKQNYIFGSNSEGTQRTLTQAGAKIVKVKDFFITGRTEWSNMGGLVGMMLTLADSASTSYDTSMEQYRKKAMHKGHPEPPRPKMNVYGPPNLKHMLATCRRFIFRKGVPVEVTEYKNVAPGKANDGRVLPTWEDNSIKVWALPIAPTSRTPNTKQEAKLEAERAHFDKELNVFEELQASESENAADREARYDQIRTATLNHMFNSTWRFDTLVERHISEIEMPAAIFVRDPVTKHTHPYTGPLPGGKEPLPDITVLTRTPWPGALVRGLPPPAPAPEALSYIVRTHPVRGKFNPVRAKELGVKPGRDYSRLSQGETVKSEKGEDVTPDMVLGPDRPGQGFAIIDLPSVEYVDNLIQREEFVAKTVVEGVRLCVWILGPGLSGHSGLEDFMQMLGPQVQHIVSSRDSCPDRLSFDSVAAQTIRLGQIDGERYHVPFHDNTALPQKTIAGSSAFQVVPFKNIIPAERGLKFRIMPNFEMRRDGILPPLDVSAIQQNTPPEILDLAKDSLASIAQDSEALQAWTQLLSRPDTDVITLGTGSALPSKYRNVSGTLVRVPGVGNYLFDAGENTLGQLQRVFGPDELVDVLRNLRMIWISHLHADHHLGTTSIIKAWYTIVHNGVPAAEPLTIHSLASQTKNFSLAVISHEGMLKWLGEYAAVEDFGYSRIAPLEIKPVRHSQDTGSVLKFVPSSPFPKYDQFETVPQHHYEAILGLEDIQACKVSHCNGAMAVSITFPTTSSSTPPLKISYSGDCRPSEQFVHIGRNSTLLIHEATFDDELLGDAIAKKHSTTSEALGIGAKMDAKAVVLTHFSQRYQKIPVLQTIDNGEEADDLLDPNAMEDVQENEDEDVDEPDNMDVSTTTTSAVPHSAIPTDSALKGNGKGVETVIKVRSKDLKVAIAFDYMRVRIGDIAKLEKFNPALEKLFEREDVEGEGDEGAEGKGESDEKKNGNGKKVGVGGEGGKKKKSKRNN
ncbi:hypothetical protein P154DRAFT_525640 [Amniculicola lignicola CBS 123094]|uniref:ribonuclease Z n=1 Tax=Amniculicola lignicola CBS 123094 TaxID=1392246 RepID=A0A6A5W6C1_9PLEO|nr:hypothetical protein P154DRAFT_525640 [Amniculicola lignicola CBS 123094]